MHWLSTDRAAIRFAAAALFGSLAWPVAAQAAPPICDAPQELIRLDHPLTHVAHKLALKEPLVIVAIGSSSTAGAGASSSAANYPSRLREELARQFPGHPIVMINRGVNGEEVADMLKRFDEAVVASKPDLVLWQLGTNSVIRDHPLNDHGESIRAGLDKIRAVGADVVLIDPQYAPKVIAKPGMTSMIDLISFTAKQENVDLFHRFAMMQHWATADHLGFETFVSSDGLHMNDWSYACMAKGLGLAIAEAAQRPVLSAKATAPLDMPVFP